MRSKGLLLLVVAVGTVLSLAPSRPVSSLHLEAEKEGDGDLRISFEHLSDILQYNLYRGNLADVAGYNQKGDPEGRCAVDPASTSLLLSSELTIPGDFYYLVTVVTASLSETAPGRDSSGLERENNFPCPLPEPPECDSHGSGGLPGTHLDLTLVSMGVTRSYHLHVPDSYDPSVASPLLIFFHGLNGSADLGLMGCGLTILADENDFIAAFPDSLTPPLSDCNPTPGKHWDTCENPPDPETSPDIVFTIDLINEIATGYNICMTEIYLHGHSYGGFFAFYAATALPEKIAAFASQSGGMIGSPPDCWPRCVPGGQRKVPAVLVHSMDDPVCPYSYSVNLHNALLQEGHEAELIPAIGHGHDYVQQKNQDIWDFLISHPLR